jgi:Ca2+/Na+ antiporter
MAEPFIKMPPSNKLVFALALPELLFMVMASRLGFDGRITVGTVFGSMFAVAGYSLRSSRP